MAVKQGGVVAKEAVATATAAAARGEGAVAAPPRLCVEDPLTGRDVAGGTNRIAQVRQAGARSVDVWESAGACLLSASVG